MNKEILFSPEIRQKISEIDNALQDDPVGRGIGYLRKELKNDFEGALRILVGAEEVYILTGFFIPSAETIETDGLSGAAFLTKALLRLKKTCLF